MDHDLKVITLELSPEIVEKIDAKIQRGQRIEEPVWPFDKKKVEFTKLSIAEQKQLAEYQSAREEFISYRHNKKAPKFLRSRSAVVESLLTEYFEANPNGQKK